MAVKYLTNLLEGCAELRSEVLLKHFEHHNPPILLPYLLYAVVDIGGKLDLFGKVLFLFLHVFLQWSVNVSFGLLE